MGWCGSAGHGVQCLCEGREEEGSVVRGVLQEKRSSDWSRACFPSSSVPASC